MHKIFLISCGQENELQLSLPHSTLNASTSFELNGPRITQSYITYFLGTAQTSNQCCNVTKYKYFLLYLSRFFTYLHFTSLFIFLETFTFIPLFSLSVFLTCYLQEMFLYVCTLYKKSVSFFSLCWCQTLNLMFKKVWKLCILCSTIRKPQ